MEYRKNTLILFFIFLSFTVYGNNSFKQLSINEGLSHTDANCITQDSTGLIWIGTYGGLQSYDGYSLQKYDYYSKQPKVYQAHNRIHSLACTDKYIWIGTESGLTSFDLETLNYTSFKISGDINSINQQITDLCYNPQSSHIIIKTQQNVFLGKVHENSIHIYPWNSDEDRIQGKKLKKFQSYGNYIYGSRGNDSEDIFCICDKNEKAIIKCKLGIENILKKDNHTIKGFEFCGNYLYIRTELGCFRFKMENDNILTENTTYIDFKDTDLYRSPYYNFAVTSTGDLWCSSKNGITEIRRPYSSNPTYHKYLDSSSQDDLSVLRVTDFLIDKYNNIWLTSTSRGVFYKNLSEAFFKVLSYDEFRKTGLSQNEIVSVCEHFDGSIWMIVEYGSLFKYNPDQETITKIPIKKPDNIFFQYIYMADDKNHIYIGTSIGVYLYKITTHQLEKIHINEEIDNASISFITKDKYDKLWIATWGDGLYRITNTINNPNVETILSAETDPALISDWISSIKIQNNRVYLCTINGLNCIYLGEEGQIKKISSYQANPNYNTSLTTNYLVAIDCENDSTCWIGTIGGGLNKIILHSDNNDDYTATSYTTNDGLSNNDCEIVMLDDNNNVWIGGNEISCLNTENGHIEIFNESPQSKAFKVCVSCKSSNGYYYMGGLYGLTSFNPMYSHSKSVKCELYFTDLTVNNELIKPQETYNGNRILEYSLQNTEKIELNYKQNNFTISFSTLNSGISSQSTFRYRIKKLDKEWYVLANGENKAYFSSLPYGNYQLEVQHSLDKGFTWHTPGKQLEIKILPPWWLSLWMKTLYIFIAAGVFIFALRHYIKEQNLKKENELQKILIEKDEERYQSKIRFFMNASHELKTPLTLILLSIEKIINEDYIRREYQIILSQARRMMSLISELVDFRKTELGISTITFTHINISNIMEKVLCDISPWTENKHLILNYEHDDEDIFIDADVEKIYKLIINILSNAIKYTNNEGSIFISLHKNKPETITPYYNTSYTEGDIKPYTDSCILVIRDTGIGISSESIRLVYERFFQVKESPNDTHLGSGLGLAIVKNIVLQHSGMITISSEREKGTEFIVTIPLHNESVENTSETVNFDISTFIQENYNELPVIDEPFDSKQEDNEDSERPCILIVEDNKDLRDMLKEYLSTNYIVKTASNGREGLELCLSIFPDIIISDVMMPEMDGIEMCRRIKNNLSIAYIPLVLLTAKDNIESQIEGYESGADFYIAKPFSMKLLEVNIKRLLILHEQNIKGIKPENEQMNLNIKDEDEEIDSQQTEEKELKEIEQTIENIREIINDNITATDLSPEFIANKLGISRSSLYRKIKKIDDMSFADYVRNYRLEKAAYLLTHTKQNIQEITYAVGFTNTSHFSKIFKIKYGVPPLEYKRKKD